MKEQAEAIKERLYRLIDRMSERIRIRIPRNQYPNVRIEEGVLEYRPGLYEFALDPKYIHSGEVVGEEIAHFIRSHAKNLGGKKPVPKFLYYLRHPGGNELDRVPSQKHGKDVHADEFFGYLGRRILQEIATGKDNLVFGKRLKPVKTQTRKEKLEHERPYRFAKAVDLGRVNYAGLFMLPDKEVRHRFFRTDPQYDFSRPAPEAKITRRNKLENYSEGQDFEQQGGLENMLRFILLPLMIILAFFATKTITGNVIGIGSATSTFISLFTITILLIIYSLIRLRQL